MAAKKTRKHHSKKKAHKKSKARAHKKSGKKRSKKKAVKKEITITAKTIMRRVCRSKHVPVSLRKYC